MVLKSLKNKIDAEKDFLVEKIMEEQIRLQPEIKSRYTERMIDKTREDIAYNLDFLTQAVFIEEKNIFSRYFVWLKSVLEGYNLDKDVLEKNIAAMRTVFSDFLTDQEFSKVDLYLNSACEEINKSNYKKSFLEKSNPYFDMAEKYLNYLLTMKRKKAVNLIRKMAESGTSVEDIYLKIFQPVQYEIGRLWQLNKISVAEEHYATSITQLAMSQLYPYIFTADEKEFSCITACIGDELHELGIRMVADLLEINGWDTIHLGSNTPLEEIVNTAAEKRVDLLAISATMPIYVKDIVDLIKMIKEEEKLKGAKTIVGGGLFNGNTGLWKKVGADAYAADGADAVRRAGDLCVK